VRGIVAEWSPRVELEKSLPIVSDWQAREEPSRVELGRRFGFLLVFEFAALNPGGFWRFDPNFQFVSGSLQNRDSGLPVDLDRLAYVSG
jgi:hypothetical protein